MANIGICNETVIKYNRSHKLIVSDSSYIRGTSAPYIRGTSERVS